MIDKHSVVLLLAMLASCNPIGSSYGGIMSQPKEARIDIPAEPLSRFDSGSRQTLFRYLAGNPRWEIREERGGRYAVRREKIDGEYQTTLNGYYSSDIGNAVRQTRVLIAFEQPYGFGVDRGNVTRTKPGSDNVAVIIESPHAGTPGNSSYIIVEGDKIFLEIYDQAPEIPRRFTQQAITDVFAELSDVLLYQDTINTTGLLPAESRYSIAPPTTADFSVSDGMQPGIYLLSAAVNPKIAGYVYARVYNVASGQRLSEERLTPRSIRYVGWSQSGQTFFPYNSEVTVYEGDWSNQYEARFELWHRSEDGSESKLAEITRLINGWQQ